MRAFARWLAQRQMAFEGGFQGRTNKLVDSCYTFWVGACFPLLERAAWEGHVGRASQRPPPPFALRVPAPDVAALARYVLGACAHAGGGLQDKPDAGRDFYHTCYALSGLSALGAAPHLRLKATDPVYNVEVMRLGRAKAWFAKLPCSHEELME